MEDLRKVYKQPKIILVALLFSCVISKVYSSQPSTEKLFYSACLSSEVCANNEIGWYCQVDKEPVRHLYKGCVHSITVYFNGGDHSCLKEDGKFNIFADVNTITASDVSVSAINDSTTCCSVTVEFIVKDVETFDIELTAGTTFQPYYSYFCSCQNYSIVVHDEIVPVKDIKAYTECNTVTVSWNEVPDYTYNVSVPELNIYNRSTETSEITFDLDQEGIQVNTSYTVIVQPSVCGRYGNSSSAVITIAMEPRMLDEVMHAFSFTNDSHGTTILKAKIALPGCPAAYPNEVLLNFTCESDVHEVSLPVIVHKDDTVMMEFELPRKHCDGIMTWQNKYSKRFDQLITIVTTEDAVSTKEFQQLADVATHLSLTCCFVTSNTSHPILQHKSFCQSPGQPVTQVRACTTFHKCDNYYSPVYHEYDILPTTPSHHTTSNTGSTTTSTSQTTTSSSGTTCTPGPSNKPDIHGEIRVNRSLFYIIVVMLCISLIVNIIFILLAIFMKRKWIRSKLRVYCSKRQSTSEVSEDVAETESSETVVPTSARPIVSSTPINYGGTGSVEQSLNAQSQPVVSNVRPVQRDPPNSRDALLDHTHSSVI